MGKSAKMLLLGLGGFIGLSFLTPSLSHAQSFGMERDTFDVSGFVKELPIVRTDKQFDNPLYDNLVHNRLEFTFNPTDKWQFRLEGRNRFRYGDQVKQFSDRGLNYGTFMNAQSGLVDLNHTWLEGDQAVIHSEIDRLYATYETGDWRFRLGRQRINWGKNRIWNPNDLFNNYSFFDFDYAKRPGVDAIRIEYFRDFNSSIEVAFNPAENLDQSIGAIYYSFHKGEYDFQLMSAYFRKEWATGLGWSGYIGDATFKGEINRYQPAFTDAKSESYYLASLSAGYTFHNSLSLHAEGIYNGNDRRLNFTQLINTSGLQANNISIFEYGIYSEIGCKLHPLVHTSLGAIHYPGQSLTLLAPSIIYSLGNNWELNVLAQLFTGETQNLVPEAARNLTTTINQVNLMTVRLKWSF